MSDAAVTGQSQTWVKFEKASTYGGAIGGYLNQGANSGLLFGTQNGSATPTERMRIDSSGNVGIGTSSPARKLEVKNTTGTSIQVTGTATTSSYPGFIISSGTQSVFTMSQSADDGTGYVSNQAAAPIIFNTSNTERMRIDSSGNVGIGTSSPAQKLHVVGNIVATGDITTAYSDDRLKNISGPITNALNKVNTLSGFYYTPNDLAISLGIDDNQQLRVGVSAQQVQAIMPEVVKESPIDKDYLTVQYEKLVPLLIEAIKELTAKVAELEKRNN